jgi:signal transduction histidine kinase
MPFVFIGGGWVFMRLATAPGLGSDLYSNLSAATPFWGRHSSFIVTLLITSGCLLGTATTVCNTPRILYQLSIDGYLAPVFSVVSRRGALEPALILTFISSALFLFWGDVNRIVVVSGVCWFVSIMAAHWALWLHRHEPDVRWGRCALGFFLIEGVVLIVGGSAWGWVDLLIGLALPIAVLALDAVIRRVPFAPFHPHWWDQIHSKPTHHRQEQDFLVLQVGVLILLVCAATAVSWLVRSWVDPLDNEVNSHLLVILIMFLAFVAVAIACWTSLPQVSAIDELAATSILQAKQLEQTLSDLKTAQMQMVQTEKMSSLGQLVAGVAHEINNPVNFIHGNLTHLQEYAQDLVRMLRLYQERHPTSDTEVQNLADEIDLEFLMEDLQKMIASMSMGTDRICNIVLSLRNFSRMDEAEFKAVDIHEGIESTLLILQHRIKARSERPAIEIIRDYSQLPLVECYPGQLNQVLMNILVNAIDALDEVNTKRSYKDIEANPSCITIRTAIHQAHWVAITIADNGPGIPDTVRDRIFDPFFTTKPVGKGTGMGMAISYQIITEKHGGMLQCFSTLGKGTEFVLQIPMRQANPPIH